MEYLTSAVQNLDFVKQSQLKLVAMDSKALMERPTQSTKSLKRDA